MRELEKDVDEESVAAAASRSRSRSRSTSMSILSMSQPLLLESTSEVVCSNRSSQMALVGAKLCPIESLDYEIIDNEFLKEEWRMMKNKTCSSSQIYEDVLMKWTLCFVVGLIMSVLGFVVNLAVENIVGLKFVVTSNLMLQGRYFVAFMVFAAWNLGLTLFAASITALIAPTAAGSGIPEVKSYLNGVDAPGIYTPRVLLVKIVGNVCAVSANLLIGKAGPMVHVGAAVASLLGQAGRYRKWLIRLHLKNDRDRRDLVTGGSAAGITAAFRAPIGGVIFAIEEMSSWWRSALLWTAFFVTTVAVVMLRAFINLCNSEHSTCGLFGKGGLIMYDMEILDGSSSKNMNVLLFHLTDVPFVVLVGVIGGILGCFLNFLLSKMARLHNTITTMYWKGPVAKISIACLISILTSSVQFGLPWLSNCQSCPSTNTTLTTTTTRMPMPMPMPMSVSMPMPMPISAVAAAAAAATPTTSSIITSCPTSASAGNYMKFQCSSGHYNPLATLIFNTNDDAIHYLYMTTDITEFPAFAVLVYFLACFSLTVLTFGIVVPAGLFVPLIVIGASYGRCLGILLASHTASLNQGLFAVLGSAALLAGSMRATVALCVILLELTNNLYLLPLVMVVLIVSKSVADTFNTDNINDILINLKGFPYLNNRRASDVLASCFVDLTVSDVVTGPLRCLQAVEKVGNVVHLLTTTTHNGFPVIDQKQGTQVLFGLVLRAHLLVLLKNKAFLAAAAAADADADAAAHHPLNSLHLHLSSLDFAKGTFLTIDDIVHDLTDQDMDMFLDLHPFANTSPFTVLETMSLPKAFLLFRELGLRHMLVLPNSTTTNTNTITTPVVGIITRHDFMLDHILCLHPALLHTHFTGIKFQLLRLFKCCPLLS